MHIRCEEPAGRHRRLAFFNRCDVICASVHASLLKWGNLKLWFWHLGRFDTCLHRFRGRPTFGERAKNIPKWSALIGFLKARGFTWQMHSATKLIMPVKQRVTRGTWRLGLGRKTHTNSPSVWGLAHLWMTEEDVELRHNCPIDIFDVTSREVQYYWLILIIK